MVATAFAVAVPVNASAATITVPDEYPTIQQAINAASSGDTVYVRAGTYYEHITIGESLTLQGEDRDTTVIDGNGSGNVIYVTANYVTISGLTIANGEHGINLIPNWAIHHITIRDAIITSNDRLAFHSGHSGGSHLIEDCIISNNWGASYAHQFHNSIIRNCEVFGNGYGFSVAWGSGTLITNNEVHDNEEYGIWFDSMSNSIIENNLVYSNGIGTGVGYVGSYNTIRNNVIRDNDLGIYMNNPTVSGNKIYHNDVIENGRQACDQGTNNIWDDGYPSGGNYWSDYTGVDATGDGIGDTPYVFDSHRDNYPLMRPWNIIQAIIDIDPDTLNLGSKGKWITSYIELPEGYLVEDSDIDSVALTMINDDLLDPPLYTIGPSEIGDYDDDDIPDLMVKFDREELIPLLEVGDAELTVAGELTDGTPFEGSDTIRVIDE